jgi:hypothetical protein
MIPYKHKHKELMLRNIKKADRKQKLRKCLYKALDNFPIIKEMLGYLNPYSANMIIDQAINTTIK